MRTAFILCLLLVSALADDVTTAGIVEVQEVTQAADEGTSAAEAVTEAAAAEATTAAQSTEADATTGSDDSTTTSAPPTSAAPHTQQPQQPQMPQQDWRKFIPGMRAATTTPNPDVTGTPTPPPKEEMPEFVKSFLDSLFKRLGKAAKRSKRSADADDTPAAAGPGMDYQSFIKAPKGMMGQFSQFMKVPAMGAGAGAGAGQGKSGSGSPAGAFGPPAFVSSFMGPPQ